MLPASDLLWVAAAARSKFDPVSLKAQSDEVAALTIAVIVLQDDSCVAAEGALRVDLMRILRKIFNNKEEPLMLHLCTQLLMHELWVTEDASDDDSQWRLPDYGRIVRTCDVQTVEMYMKVLNSDLLSQTVVSAAELVAQVTAYFGIGHLPPDMRTALRSIATASRGNTEYLEIMSVILAKMAAIVPKR